MDIIYEEEFKFAEIHSFKNYSSINDRQRLIHQSHTSTNYILDCEETYDMFIPNRREPKNFGGQIQLPQVKSRWRRFCYFNDDREVSEAIYLTFLNEEHAREGIFTTDPRVMDKYVFDPFSNVRIHVFRRAVTLKDNKLTIKVYNFFKKRDVNSKFFKKDRTVFSITLNLVTGNFTVLNLHTTPRGKQSKQFRTNSFPSLILGLGQHKELFASKYYSPSKSLQDKPIFEEFKSTIRDEVFTQAVLNSIGLPLRNDLMGDNGEWFVYNLFKWFVEKKQIKVPDNHAFNMVVSYYPTERFLKKNERKLVSAVLDRVGIKSKITIKVVHKYGVNIKDLYVLCKILGEGFHKYVGSVMFKKYTHVATWTTSHPRYGDIPLRNNIGTLEDTQLDFDLTNTERENIVRVINDPRRIDLVEQQFRGDSSDATTLDRVLNEIVDHLNMIVKVRAYGIDISFSATSRQAFIRDHAELGKIVGRLKKGWTTEYVFNEKMANDVERPIPIEVDLTLLPGYVESSTNNEMVTFKRPTRYVEYYHPHILKREDEYVEEGEFMRHCVSSYVDKEKSIIISIRNKDGDQRITCEFSCQTGKCIQARYFSNAAAPADFEDALYHLTPKIEKYARLGMLHYTEKRKVPLRINGKDIVPQNQEPSTSIFALRPF